MTDPLFLPGVPADLVLAALRRSPGGELSSGKFDSAESSAALAVNAFGWFLDRPKSLPPLPGVPMGPPETVEVEAEMRFPWAGGRHPWLDVAITTPTTLVGVESKRYEPFRPRKSVGFSEAYDSRDWGAGMARFGAVRQALASGQLAYRHLDAVQLVKHAYGLWTQGQKRARGVVLVYLHAEPAHWANSKPVDPAGFARHQEEIADFAGRVKGDVVTFASLRWSEVLADWSRRGELAAHAAAVSDRFGPL